MMDLSFTDGEFESGIYGNRQREFSYLGESIRAEVIEYNHAYALMMDEAKSMEVVTVTEAGTVITWGELRREVCRAIAAPFRPRVVASLPYGSTWGYRSIAELGW